MRAKGTCREGRPFLVKNLAVIKKLEGFVCSFPKFHQQVFLPPFMCFRSLKIKYTLSPSSISIPYQYHINTNEYIMISISNWGVLKGEEIPVHTTSRLSALSGTKFQFHHMSKSYLGASFFQPPQLLSDYQNVPPSGNVLNTLGV